MPKKSNFTTSRYQPDPESLAARMIAFLQKNPDEKLNSADIEIKFDVPAGNVRKSLAEAVEYGSIALVARDYCAGPLLITLKELVVAPKAIAMPAPAPTPAAQKQPFDPLQLAIESGVAVPIKAPRGQAESWLALFTKMQKGQSVTFPQNNRCTAQKCTGALKKQGVAAFTYRVDTSTKTVRVWRTA